ncbi:LysR family transcriptional regulator [Actinomadura keratinilytica]
MLERLELEAFLALAEELHFGRTAERLHVTTGRVSQLLKKLEGRVGAPSSYAAAAPSNSPRSAASSARISRAAMSRSRAEWSGPSRRRAGRGIRSGPDLSAPSPSQVIHRAARKCAEEGKGFAVLMREVQVSASLTSLREGHVDVLAMSLPVTAPDIVVGPVLFSEPRMLGVPAGHRLA